MSTLIGADISGWQPGTVNLSGLAFCIVKATEGTGYKNPNYVSQVAEIIYNGLLLGRYHFADGGDPVAEARFFVASTTDRRSGEIQVLDVERPFTRDNPDPVGWSVAWLTEVHRLTGNMPLLYLNASDRGAHDWTPVVKLNAGLWDAEYNPTGPMSCAPWPFVAIWQNSDHNQTGGDSDVFEADHAAWLRYGANSGITVTPTSATPAPAPKPAPKPVPVPVHPAPAGPTQWIVDPGNTMGFIAGQVGVSLAALEAANPGINPNLIYPKQVLRLPAGAHWPGHAVPAPAPAPARPHQCRVLSGDSFSSIAAQFGVTLTALENANPGLNYNLIYPGEILDLP